MLTVYPVDVLYQTVQGKERAKLEADIQMVYSTVTGRKMDHFTIQAEYAL